MNPPRLDNKHNSYFFSAQANNRFSEYMDKKLEPFRQKSSAIGWWRKDQKYPLHCTLGFLFGSKDKDQASPKEVQALNQKLSNHVFSDLSKAPHSVLTQVVGFSITNNGWVTLVFKPKKKLNALHQKFIQEMKECIPNPAQIGGFAGHFSVGTLKYGADQNKALAELKQLFLEIKKDPQPFVIRDLELVHTRNNANQSLMHTQLHSRDLGILEVKSNGQSNYTIKFKDIENAQKLTKRLTKYYGMEKKTINLVKDDKFGSIASIILNKNEYEKIKGHFLNLI